MTTTTTVSVPVDGGSAVKVVEDLMRARHSCRAFLDRPVPREVIARLLTVAQRSPSWCNTQPWELVITDAEATAAFRTAFRRHLSDPPAPDLPFPETYSGIYQERRRACGWALYESVGIAKGDRDASARQAMKNFEFFDAPHVAVLTTARSLGMYGAIDCGVYLGILLLAAQSLGLAAIPQASIASYSPFLHEYFGLPDDRQVVCAVSFGYPDPEAPANGFRTDRAAIEDVVTWWPAAQNKGVLP